MTFKLSLVLVLDDQMEVVKVNHEECGLVGRGDTIEKRWIDSGLFINCRRKLLSLYIISHKHPITNVCFKSSYSIRREKLLHLVNHPWMIHPFSLVNLYWELFIFWAFIYMVAIYAATCLYIFNDDVSDKLRYGKLTGDLIFLVDFLHFFLTGYYDKPRSLTVLSPKWVARKYLLSYCMVDLLALSPSFALPLEWLTGVEKEGKHPIFRWIRFTGLIRVFRIYRCSKSWDLYKKHYKIASKYIKIVKLVFIYILIVFFAFTLMFVVRENTDTFHIESLRDFFFSSQVVLAVSNLGKLKSEELGSALLAVFLLLGYSIGSFLYVEVYQVWVLFDRSRNLDAKIWKNMCHFMTVEALPVDIRRKLRDLFDFRYRNSFYNEELIYNFLSEKLKREILFSVFARYAGNLKILKGLSEENLQKLVGCLKCAVYLEDDVVMSKGKSYNSMYFILYGTVAVYSLDGREVCHLEDGENFGEIRMLLGCIAPCTFVAATACEIYKLKREDVVKNLDESSMRQIMDEASKMMEMDIVKDLF